MSAGGLLLHGHDMTLVNWLQYRLTRSVNFKMVIRGEGERWREKRREKERCTHTHRHRDRDRQKDTDIK